MNDIPSGDTPLINRRNFLARTARGAAISAIAPGLAFPAEQRETNTVWRLRLSTSSIHFKTLSIDQTCERIAALGFEAIDIWCAYDHCPHLDDVRDRLGSEGLKDLLAKHRLKLHAFSTYVGGYARYAELLGKAGGGVAVQGSAAPCRPVELAAKMRAFLEELKPLVALAEQHQSRLAIENHGSALLDSLDSLKAFVDLNRSPRLGIALAPYHLQVAGASVEEAIAVCGRQLFFFYAWQNQPGTGQLPGHGPTDFKPWLNALRRANYPSYVNPFMHGHVEPAAMSAALAQSRDYLTNLV